MMVSMVFEDFLFMLCVVLRVYVWFGIGKVDYDFGLYVFIYDFNDDMLSVGVEFWCRLLEEFLLNIFVNDG